MFQDCPQMNLVVCGQYSSEPDFFLQVWCLGANAMSMLTCPGDRTSGHAVGFAENQYIMSLVLNIEQQVMETLLSYSKHSICMYHYHVAIISVFASCYFKSFGQCFFSFMAPSIWNSLPATLRNVPTLSQFKSQLKTFLFAQAFL